jgi:hypothetical protein
MVDYLTTITEQLGIPLALLIIILIWSQIWKLLALWKSARKGSIIWFIVLALINTVGILEILYIFVFSKMKCCELKMKKKTSQVKKPVKKKVSKKKNKRR